ncbi:PEPxxWA-CTERM sorting domain-containing protein [Phenylobacterium sp.]|uniref:PEPxxWA-CTERM sorting domain-containing protein n=1 Tax=Phenylobacterium sp. TaxID=1871053 RepID=UPI00289CB6A1|nr:PEPxxWA-CTERM sorting domain-containing protein [Phenylobacterium sp.]
MFRYLPAAAAAVALGFAAVPAAEAATVFSGTVNTIQANNVDPGLVVQTGNFNSFSLPLEVGVTSAPVGLFSIWTNEADIGWDDLARSNIFVQLQFSSPTGPWTGGPIGGETFGVWGVFKEGGRVEWDGPATYTFGNGGKLEVSLNNTNFNWGDWSLFNPETNPGQQYGAVVEARFKLVELPSAVPEPATWAMMITGFGLAGVAIRRRRESLVAA